MQTTTLTGTAITLFPRCNSHVIDPTIKKSVAYAEARSLLRLDHDELAKSNVALAGRLRREYRNTIIETMGGTVEKEFEKGDKGKYKLVVKFKDGSKANL